MVNPKDTLRAEYPKGERGFPIFRRAAKECIRKSTFHAIRLFLSNFVALILFIAHKVWPDEKSIWFYVFLCALIWGAIEIFYFALLVCKLFAKKKTEEIRRQVYLEYSASRPFELDTETKILKYRGRRNVAFGCETINKMFIAFLNNSKEKSNPNNFLHCVGFDAGRTFAEVFNSKEIDVRAHRESLNFKNALKVWESYDDPVGFGDFVFDGLNERLEGPCGTIQIKHLFTSETAGKEGVFLCSWMEGYIAGFLTYAKILGPKPLGSATVVVKHQSCPCNNTSKDGITSVFDVSTDPRPRPPISHRSR